MSSCWRRFRAWCGLPDIRFKSPDDEASFKESLQTQLLKTCNGLIFFVLVWGGVSTWSTWRRESQRIDGPFQWSSKDPRFPFFFSRTILVLMSAVLAMGTCARLVLGYLKALDWERCCLIYTATASALILPSSPWHCSTAYGVDPWQVWAHDLQSSELISVLALIMISVLASNYMPLRVCTLWVALTVPLISYSAVIYLVGSQFPSAPWRQVVMMTFINLCSYHGALRNEQHVRDKWLALLELQKAGVQLQDRSLEVQALQRVAGTSCEIVVLLDSELKVVRSDESHNSFFGKSIAGERFVTFLADGDRERFARVAQEVSASQSMQSIPATLQLDFAILDAQFVMIGMGSSSAHIMVGLHSVERKQDLNVVMEAPSLAGGITSQDPHAGGNENISLADEWRSVWDTRSCAAKSCETYASASSAQVFANLNKIAWDDEGLPPGELRDRLEHIADCGVKEHWLVGVDEVELMPDHVLGHGGFGVVLAARLRGTAAAAKLPRHLASGQSMKFLVSVVNELRLHRHIRHPNIVPFYGACIDPEIGGLVPLYELVRGLQLDKFVSKVDANSGRPAGLVELKLALDIACALRYLHSLSPRIVHGDVKPSNVLVEQLQDVPRAKVLDLGLSRLVTRRADPLGGTRLWIAPELCESRAVSLRPSPSSDVFSFGLVLHLVLTRQYPPSKRRTCFPESSSTSEGHKDQTFEALVLNWPDGTPYMDDGAQWLCTECLRNDFTARPGMDQVQSRLLKWLPEDPLLLKRLGWEVLALVLPSLSWESVRSIVQATWSSQSPPAEFALPKQQDEKPGSSNILCL